MKQEPVAWMTTNGAVAIVSAKFAKSQGWTPLYTAPKELSDEEAYEIFELEAMKNRDYDWKAGVRAILKKASEK